MARLPNLERENLSPEHQQYYDEIEASRGGVRGPFGVLLHSPELAARAAATGHYVRFMMDMPNSLKEVVICATAAEIKSQYEFSAHAELARKAGVSDDTIQAIAKGTAPQGLSGDEELLVRYTQELLRDHKITDETYNAVVDRWGVLLTVDVTGLIGHYLLVGQFLAAFEVDLRPGMKSELPE
jgi:4-carboxymuconolactone decarboxylase